MTTAVTVTEWKKIRDAGLPRPRDVSDVEEPSSRRPQARALGSSVFAAGGVRARRVREGRGEVCASVCVKRKLQRVLDLNSNHGLTNETLISGRPEIISGNVIGSVLEKHEEHPPDVTPVTLSVCGPLTRLLIIRMPVSQSFNREYQYVTGKHMSDHCLCRMSLHCLSARDK